MSWATGSSAFTAPFEELTAYLAQVTDRTTVSRLTGISWQAVGSIVERVVARRLDAGRFDELTRIGCDEFSHRKRHHYLTVVVDHDRRRVVWAGEGRSARTLQAFLGGVPPPATPRRPPFRGISERWNRGSGGGQRPSLQRQDRRA